jgi:lysyl-tRNA synthetase, class II
MANLSEIREIRLKKMEAIKRSFLNPYPQKSKRTHKIKEALNGFGKLSRLKEEVILAGRIKSLRTHGSSAFLDIEDGSASSPRDGTGKIQGFLRKNSIGEQGYKSFFKIFDIGDFVELRGVLFKTKRGEKTINIADYKILAKSLLPLPEKWHGLKDTEERFRKRYLDLIFNPEVKFKFKTRSNIIKEIRNFLNKEGFLEVETPILQSIYGGAKARPFKTHLNAQNLDLYLRIALELHLKRLLVGGFEKIYELGKCFRNEGVDRSHNPDFTMLEFYWAYADYKDMMKFTEKMFNFLLKKVFNGLKIKYQGKEINFKKPWPRIEFSQLLKKYTKINLDEINLEALKKEALKLGVKTDKMSSKPEIADEIYKKYCLPKIWQPAFVINHPMGFFPLAKAHEKDAGKLSNFQLIIAGWELVNAFSELNDPVEQRKRFEEQEKLFKKGLEEAQRMDQDFITALEYGMPPAAGFGMGIDRLVALLTDSRSLREVILFPTMKPN